MAGHNKWSKVKHIKGPADAKRSRMFSKMSKEISIAARDGGDPDLNPRLRTAINTAKSQSMPKDTIERAIKKGTGELGGNQIEEVCYEGYAPGGVAVMVEMATDNKNRSAADVRQIFSKNNGSLGSSGSVAYMFERKGEIRIPLDAASEEEILEKAMDAGAEDTTADDEHHIIRTGSSDLNEVADAIRNSQLEVTSQELVQIPGNTMQVTEKGIASQVLRLYEALDGYEDTISVYSNFDIPDEVLEQLDHH